MRRLLLNLTLLLCFGIAQAQSIFNPNDPVVTYNGGAAAGSAANPIQPGGYDIRAWVRTPRVAWNTDRYKCYIIGNIPFRLRFPNSYVPGANDGKKYPVVLFFHGGGEATTNIRDNEFQLFNGGYTFQDKILYGPQDAFVLFPQSKYVSWDDSYYTPMNIVIDELIKNCKADPDRVISMGLSIGGYASLDYAVRYPQRASTVIASSPVYAQSFNYAPAIHVPLWVSSGGMDNNPDPVTFQNFINYYKPTGGSLYWSFFPAQYHTTWDWQWAEEPNFGNTWATAHKANPMVYFNNRFFCPGSPVSSRMGITGGFYAYQWDKNGVIISGATGNEYIATDFGTYRARFKRTAASDWSAWSLAPAVIVPVCPPLTGSGTGLKATYFNNTDLAGAGTYTRTDANMNFIWEATSPAPGIATNHYSVRWTGKIQSQFSETYTIYTKSDEGIRLWINGVQLVNNYVGHGPFENSANFTFVAGQKYDIKIEYYNLNDGGQAILKWSSPSTVKQVVPKTQLYPEGTGDPDGTLFCTTNLSPANAAVLSSTTTTLAWAAAANATSYDLYLWTGATPPATPTANTASTSYNVSGLIAGSIYNWYVVPKNATTAATGCGTTGKTTFSVSGSLPACATNTAPVNASTIATQTTASLTWSTIATATSYDVYVWTGATAPAAPTANVTTASYSATGLTASTLYNWYVVPKNASGSASGCNVANKTTFTTAAVAAPLCTTNASPVNGSTIATATTASLTWGVAANATSYDVYIWTGATPPASATANVATNAYSAASLTGSTAYNWYVIPKNSAGAATGCNSNSTSFTTAPPPPPCTVNLLPANNAVLATANTATLTWTSVASATSYDVYVWTGATVPTTPTANAGNATYSAAGLTAGATYNWYVSPKNASGAATGCGTTNKSVFVTAPPPVPVCVTNILPANGSTIATANTAALSWNAEINASSYDVYVWTGLTAPAAPTANVTTTTYAATSLTASTLYNWYVVPKNIAGSAAGCATTNKTTFATAPAGTTAGTGLQGVYYNGIALAGTPLLTRVDPTINFKFDWDQQPIVLSPAPGIVPDDNYSVRWTGFVKPAFSETYTFYSNTDDGIRVWVNNVLLIDSWIDQDGSITRSGTIALVGGQKYDIKVEFYEKAAASLTKLWWSSPSTPKVIIPQAALYPAGYVDPAVPGCTSNTSPANGANIATGTTAALTWTAVSGATSYDVYVWTGATPPASPTANVATASYTATGLAASALYNWYVVPKNSVGSTAGCISNSTSFTTGVPAAPACTANLLPANNATLATTTAATLTWTAAASATSYDVYVWTGATPPASPTANVTTATYSATGLTAGTTYNWYVSPKNVSGAATGCGTTNKSIFTTAPPPAPACATNTAPANGSTIASQTTASLTWSTIASATSYDVYVWTGATPPATATANVTAASYTAISLIAGTTYNWYVVPKNTGGAAAGCDVANKTTFTTAALPVPACVTNAVPVNGTTIATQTTAALSWGAAATAVSYDIYVWSGATPPALPTANVAGVSFTVNNLTASTLYNWYVVPKNASGPAAGCGATNATVFTTASIVIPVPDCAINSLPVDGASIATTTTAALTWSAAANATSYDVYLWTGATVPTTPIANTATANYNATGLTPSALYNWYVVPKNTGGAATGCATTSKTSFTTAGIAPPTCIANSSPANGVTIATPTTATLSWGTAANATAYDVYLWTGAVTPTTPVATVTAATTYNATGLTASSLYNWYVVPKNEGGNATGCAANATIFTTAAGVPLCAVNTSPANGAHIATTTTAALSWEAAAGAASYDVYIWTGATPPAIATANTNSTSYTATNLTDAALYNWYVIPKNASGAATGCAGSNKSTFTTASLAAPACALNTLPADGTTVISQTDAELQWAASPTATSYDVYLWTGAIPPVLPVATLGEPGYVASGLTPATTYNWYVVPKNASGNAAGCEISNTTTFTTAAAAVPVPDCAINTSPADNSTVAAQTTATLTWGTVADATSYDIYIWKGATPPAAAIANVTATTYDATGLTAGTQYNWYVVPRNDGGSATSCAVNASVFTTSAIPVPACAVNASPADNSTIAAQTTATLNWGDVANATSYDVYIWTGATAPTTATATVTLSTYDAAGLVAGTLYNWYVVPKNTSGAATGCAGTNATAFTTAATGIPLCVTNTAPVNAATIGTQTTASLTWTAAATASSYDVFIWTGGIAPTTPVANVTVPSYNAMGLIASSQYTWYVVPRNASGSATGCAATNASTFTTASLAPPACAVNAAPLDGSVIATATTAALSWNTVAAAASYDVYVWTGATPPATPTANVITASYTAINLVGSTTYNWYLIPKNTGGSAAGCGSTNVTSFTTATIVTPPVCAVNASPLNSSTIATQTTAALSWSTIANATSYDVYVWTGATPPATATANVTAASYTPTNLIAGTIYSWYVIPKNAAGPATGCDINNKTIFTTAAPALPVPACVTNTSPASNSTLATQNTATLTWPSSATATSYDLYLAAGTGTPTVLVTNTSALTYSATGLTAATTYSWFIAPKNASGANTACATSNKTTFTTAAAVTLPACIINTLPANAAVLPSQTSARLTWPASPGAASYDVYLAAGNAVPTVLRTNTTALTYYATGLAAGTLYSWYIAPRNANGANTACGASNRTTFTTAAATGGANQPPVANGGTNITITLPVSTTTLNGTASYDPDGSVAEYYWYQAQGPVTTSIMNFSATPAVTGLTTAGTYIIVLQVKDNNGVPSYSQVTVTVNPAGTPTVPACVPNSSPAAGATLATQTTATLTWPSSASATSYDVYLAAGAGIPATLVTNTTALTYSATGLTTATTYSWYIAPRNAIGAATACATSNTTTFITAAAPTVPPVCVTNTSPANAATILTANTASLSWNTAANASSYDVYIWTGATAPVAPTATVTATSYTALNLVASTIYSWYVVPKNASGPATGCDISNNTTFTTAAPPPIPSCVANVLPATGSTIATQTTAALSWNAGPTATSYNVYVWTGATPPATPTANVTAAAYSATGLTAATTYNWYVAPVNASGTAVGCEVTNKSTFATAAALAFPACVINTLPASGAVLPSQTSARITWPASAGAVSYDVYLAAGNAVPTVLRTNTTALTYYATGLAAGTLYSWYIAPRNANGANTACGSTSRTTFTTAAATGGGNIPPVAIGGTNITITLPVSTATLNGTASYDPDGSVAEYYWYQAQGPVTTSLANFAATPVVTGLTTAGTYIFSLQVKDNNGVPSWSSVTVTVRAAGAPLVADAGANVRVAATTDAVSASIVSAVPSVNSTVSPNPVKPGQSARVQVNSDKIGTAVINIVNSNGYIISTQKINMVPGVNTTKISTSSLGQGLYIINITGGDKPMNIKLLVE